ncbi:NUDIX domain-containing protein [Nocardiopsis suaedae]|uniref:NUDIX domain-containing protein n=1 Tax=Nocardiopsis suaedae TaxID=3018444 RepID=A0ABT4TKC1_9ACTN|nr:NUDIX domain-containing protein [Nocardiopsis suaedae]MDA2804567.1 NUDIX domain-containing protein [Nocardiopsis suaedae]
MPSLCCGTSVGGRVRRTAANGDEEYAILYRAWWPIGGACIAGHGKDKRQASFETAMREEADEELGLKVLEATEVLTVHLPNLCSAPPADAFASPGHLWTVFDLEVAPDARLLPDPEETRGAEWVTGDRLREMAAATIAFARSGRPAAEQPADSLEAVWVELCHRLGDITVSDADRSSVRGLYSSPPPEYYRGGRPGAGR